MSGGCKRKRREPTNYAGAMRVAVTGGAGYIGAHAVDALQGRGDEVLVIDDLSTGDSARLSDVEVLELDLASDRAGKTLGRHFRERRPDAVIHFAALKRVDESIERPGHYYRVNLASTVAVIDAMREAAVPSLLLSSSAAVYGEVSGRVDESHPTLPLNPYGATKLACEVLVDAAARAGQLRGASLRYFNVAGSSRPVLADRTIANLVTIVMDRVSRGEAPVILGNDYPTADGTCIRDFIHVADVADAHVAVLDWLATASGHTALNIGTGVGTSVRDVVALITEAMGSDLEPIIAPRREGDPAESIADVSAVTALTGWRAAYSLDQTVTSAVDAHTWWATQPHA